MLLTFSKFIILPDNVLCPILQHNSKMLQHNILCLILLIVTLFVATQSSPLAPALYIFGDSLVDNGNNNMLLTLAKADYDPYSINFPGQVSRGRFTDGRTVADFIAEYIGLSYPAPYASLPRYNSSMGYNYASAACGILPESGAHFGRCFPMDEQIEMFRSTIESQLTPIFKDPGQLSHHLSKSVFVVCVGSNDYLQNYFQLYPSSQLYDPVQFAQLLTDKLSRQIKSLYELGARKVLVMEIGPLGCIPTVARHPRRLFKLGGHKNEKCDEDASDSASAFNKQLPFMIQKLTSILPDSLFTIGAVYQISHDAIMHPAKYGFSDSSNPCCTTLLNGMFLCVRYQAACPDSSKHIFWDGYHPTENAFSKLVTQWIEDSSTCFPIGFKQFIEA